MQRTFVVTGLEFQDPESPSPPREVSNLGISTLELVKMANMAATGVRADLQINESSALDTLKEYYSEQTTLDWTFHLGGNAQSITMSLRWTKFDRSSGQIQIVRNVVMRDLIAEAEGPHAAESTGRPTATS